MTKCEYLARNCTAGERAAGSHGRNMRDSFPSNSEENMTRMAPKHLLGVERARRRRFLCCWFVCLFVFAVVHLNSEPKNCDGLIIDCDYSHI